MINKEVLAFANAVIKEGAAIEVGDSKTANKAYNEIHKSYLKLKEQGKIIDFKILLQHESPYVRLWSAGYLLPIFTEESEDILYDLGKLEGISVAFDARMTLSEWKKGNLKF